MAEAPVIVRVTRDFTAPPEAVFDAWLDPKAAAQFWFRTETGVLTRCEIEPRVGGAFLIVERRGESEAEHFGNFLEIDRPRRLVFSFAAVRDEGMTRVEIDIVKTKTGCRLTLTHEMDPQWAAYEAQTARGWTMILDGLARVVG